ncbi:hypothetical protein YPC_1789 [Yersinia pestis biovar Medievalis str. Harbin 35]|nr:hypothetical protein YPC_1789 [Yersinia pestis biovar Medievalis str. Harbin 35]EEO76574.1 hypothetical protein YP516_2171 [Yersinia pestis Nepal516]EEO81462.1 hypothetical protein YPF_2187 [Yersinia pestis biovar Orientalis str. India 195]EEO84185.1 hypothetical protein YPH_4065 [Yersinia pestis biovar Orientalis str. PEXU2]EEO90569.1 hypothetical protein YPS_2309 [Yersinia pestis Pestoides A]
MAEKRQRVTDNMKYEKYKPAGTIPYRLALSITSLKT